MRATTEVVGYWVDGAGLRTCGLVTEGSGFGVHQGLRWATSVVNLYTLSRYFFINQGTNEREDFTQE